MRKKLIKKLYTYYTVEGNLDDIRNNPDHIFKSYSSGKAECIKYYNTVSEWLEEIMHILTCKNKHGFGLKVFDENGENNINLYNYDLECTTCACNKLSEDEIITIMAGIIAYYFNGNSYYYEIEDDYIHMGIELTSHMYRNSPYESCDSCGNCDGARCESCKKQYIVKDLNTDNTYYIGYNEEEAQRIYEEHKKCYCDIINHIIYHYDTDPVWYAKEIGYSTDIKALYKILHEYKIPYAIVK